MNAAYYFSTFANVSQSNSNNFGKSIGTSKDDWHTWDYENWLQDTAKVCKKATDLSKSGSNSKTQHNNLTTYISEVLKSQQEEFSLVSTYISQAKCEPLHLKNNCVKELMKVFKICGTIEP